MLIPPGISRTAGLKSNLKLPSKTYISSIEMLLVPGFDPLSLYACVPVCPCFRVWIPTDLRMPGTGGQLSTITLQNSQSSNHSRGENIEGWRLSWGPGRFWTGWQGWEKQKYGKALVILKPSLDRTVSWRHFNNTPELHTSAQTFIPYHTLLGF